MHKQKDTVVYWLWCCHVTVSKNSKLHVIGMRVPWLLIATVAQCGGSLISSFSGFAGTTIQRTDREMHKVICNQAFQSDNYSGSHMGDCASAKLSIQSSTSSENSLEDAPVDPTVSKQQDSLMDDPHPASRARPNMMETSWQPDSLTLIRRNLCKTPALAHEEEMHTDERTAAFDYSVEYAREQNQHSIGSSPLAFKAEHNPAYFDSTTHSFNGEFAPRGPSDLSGGTLHQSYSRENTTSTDRGQNEHTANHSFDLLLASFSRLFDYTSYEWPHYKSRSKEDFGQRPGYGRG